MATKLAKMPYPPDLQEFVQHELASGSYKTEGELIVAALMAFRELKDRHKSLHRDVRRAIEQADRGQVRPLDTKATLREARIRLAQRR